MRQGIKSLMAFGILCTGLFAGISNTQAASDNNTYKSLEGKVTFYDGKNITIDVPFDGTQTYSVDANVRISDRTIPLAAGVLAEIEGKNGVVTKIKTEKTFDDHGTIISITNSEVTIEKNGQQVIFTKSNNFRLDNDGYRGDLKGLRGEFSIDKDDYIVELEVDHD